MKLAILLFYLIYDARYFINWNKLLKLIIKTEGGGKRKGRDIEQGECWMKVWVREHLISILKGNRDWNYAYQSLNLRLYAKVARISRLVILGWKICKWLFLNEHINIVKFYKKCLNFNLIFGNTGISIMLFPLVNGYILI